MTVIFTGNLEMGFPLIFNSAKLHKEVISETSFN